MEKLAYVPTDDGLKMGSIFMERILTICKNDQKSFHSFEWKLKRKEKMICTKMDKSPFVYYPFMT